MGVGKCRHCGYEPVASDTRRCPNCGEKVSNLGVVFRYALRGAVIGIILGAVFRLVGTVLGMIWAFNELGSAGTAPNAAKLAEGISHAVVVTLLGALAGLLIGFLAGIVVGLGAWAVGKQ